VAGVKASKKESGEKYGVVKNQWHRNESDSGVNGVSAAKKAYESGEKRKA